MKYKKYVAGKYTRARAPLARKYTNRIFESKDGTTSMKIVNYIERHNFCWNDLLTKSNRTEIQTYKVEERTFGTPCTFSLNGFLSRHSFCSVVTNRLVITMFLKSFSWYFLLYFLHENSVRWYYWTRLTTVQCNLHGAAFLLTPLMWCLCDKHRWHFAFHVLGSQMFVALVLRSLVYYPKASV